MDLRSDKRQNTPKQRGSSSMGRGEAQETGRREIESLSAFREHESPADTDRIMEEICEWENLKEAMWRVKANKGSAGIDGMTVEELPDYRDLLVIREQVLNGTYPDGAGSVCPASGNAGTAEALGPDVLR